jgi:hypothetical protein
MDRTAITGVALAVVVASLLGITAFYGAEADRQRRLNDLKVAKLEGYAACMGDVMVIVAEGGGVDEILAFSKAKSGSYFSDEVKASDFSPEK